MPLKLSKANIPALKSLFDDLSDEDFRNFTCGSDIFDFIEQHNTTTKSTNIDPSTQCNGRAFRGGRGGRCTRKCVDGEEFCAMHLRPFKGKEPSYCKECSKHLGRDVIHVLKWEHTGRYNEPCNIPHFTGEDDLMPGNKTPKVPLCQIISSESDNNSDSEQSTTQVEPQESNDDANAEPQDSNEETKVEPDPSNDEAEPSNDEAEETTVEPEQSNDEEDEPPSNDEEDEPQSNDEAEETKVEPESSNDEEDEPPSNDEAEETKVEPPSNDENEASNEDAESSNDEDDDDDDDDDDKPENTFFQDVKGVSCWVEWHLNPDEEKWDKHKYLSTVKCGNKEKYYGILSKHDPCSKKVVNTSKDYKRATKALGL